MLISSPKQLLFTYILVLVFHEFVCKCHQSYVTICDSLEDIKQHSDAPVWTELIVGNETTRANPLGSFDLHQIFPFPRLVSLIIIGQLNRLARLEARCEFDYQLQVLTFYKNDIKTIESLSIPGLKLRKVSFVNNNIEYVEQGAIKWGARIEAMDLSNNKIEVIEKFVFRSPKDSLVTKILSMRNNKISFIQEESLPESLEVLNLDGNQLRDISDAAIDNLPELQELTLSNNHLYKVPKLSGSPKLRLLDFSSNNIQSISNTTFHNLSAIYVINLSNNKLTETNFLDFSHLLQKPKRLYLSLGFNHLTGFKFDNVTDIYDHRKGYDVQLSLYGNPFFCNNFDVILKSMKKLHIKQNECDLKFQSEGKTPYCMDHYVFYLTREDKIKEFLKLIENNRKLIPCQLNPPNYGRERFFNCVL